MAFSNIDNLAFGKVLQIAFSEGIRNQISRDFRDWEYIKRSKVADPMGREIRFMFQSSYGPAAVQYRNPNGSSDFPAGQQTTNSENTAVFKELDATIELEYNLWKRAQLSGDVRYAEPLAREIEAKMNAIKRQMSKDLYGDGLGVVGQCTGTNAVESGNVRFTLSSADSARGHVGFFEYGDILILRAAAGTASAFDSNLATEPLYWKVISRRRSDNSVVLQGLDTNLAAVTIASITTPTTSGDVFYRYGQPSIVNLSTFAGDYGSGTEVIPGLESLTANDGRLVHGITMSGATAGTRYDAGGVQIDVSHIEALMNDVKVNTGRGEYNWKMANMAPETRSQFINGRETDRRFVSVDDVTRGAKKFCYQHEDDLIELNSSEYCPKTRMYIIPEAKSAAGRVLEYHGTDFLPVAVDGNSKFLKPSSSGGHQRKISSYLEGYGTLINQHPAAVGVLGNFLIS